MVEKKARSKPQRATGQRTLLDLFPLKRAGSGIANCEETSRVNARCPSNTTDVELLDTQSGPEIIDATSEGSALAEEPPNSPVIISEAPSTPSSHIVLLLDDDEALGGSQDVPIVIDSSPAQTKERREPPKKLWSIFAALPSVQPTSPTKRSPKPGLSAPFPMADAQHVRGAQSKFAPTFTHPRALKREACSAWDGQTGIQTFLREDPTYPCQNLDFGLRPCHSEEDKFSCLNAIPEEHKNSHPAIKNAITTDIPAPPSQLWADKWRPRCAEEVLSNEKSAFYLRDWLRALALQLDGVASHETNQEPKSQGKGAPKEPRGVKRPRVVRAVEKKKRRRIDSEDEDDNWIVYDDESEEDTFLENEDDDLNLGQTAGDTPPSQGLDELSSLHTFERLTNTIILAGPSGSGKTACVYACAEELKWDVFEVYPGIGKRNGASIDNMIGDVGKNHLVKKATMNCGAEAHNTSRLESIKSDKPDAAAFTPRQSLVLLEEADILFKDDTNFWPTIVNFLKDCKRPVIFTCNDLSLIPTFDLPWQNILMFEPCPSPVAASYLQAVCCNEGWSVDRGSLTRLYETPYEYAADGDEDSLQRSAPDLRRSMHQLQLWCSSPPQHKDSMIDERSCGARACSPCLGSGDEKDIRRTLKILRDHSEVVSFLDSEKSKFQSTREDCSASSEDKIGRMILYEEEVNGGLLGNDRNGMITSTATRLARGTLDACITRGEGEPDSFGTAELFRARVDKTLRNFIRVRDMGLGRTEVYTEYRAYIMEMVKAEEEREREWEAEQEGRKGRRTRNSNRYEREFRVSVEERRQLGIE